MAHTETYPQQRCPSDVAQGAIPVRPNGAALQTENGVMGGTLSQSLARLLLPFSAYKLEHPVVPVKYNNTRVEVFAWVAPSASALFPGPL